MRLIPQYINMHAGDKQERDTTPIGWQRQATEEEGTLDRPPSPVAISVRTQGLYMHPCFAHHLPSHVESLLYSSGLLPLHPGTAHDCPGLLEGPPPQRWEEVCPRRSARMPRGLGRHEWRPLHRCLLLPALLLHHLPLLSSRWRRPALRG